MSSLSKDGASVGFGSCDGEGAGSVVLETVGGVESHLWENFFIFIFPFYSLDFDWLIG